jgi:hypothetical protein
MNPLSNLRLHLFLLAVRQIVRTNDFTSHDNLRKTYAKALNIISSQCYHICDTSSRLSQSV